jgi:magnesium-transporting ATPase (P-type)
MAKDGAVSLTSNEGTHRQPFLTVVVKTGDKTFIGQIANLTGGESGNESPLAVEMYVWFTTL